MFFVFTDGKGRETIVEADNAVEAEAIYRREVGEANYSFTHIDQVILKAPT